MLAYIVNIIALILIEIDSDFVKLPISAYTITVIMYGIIVVLFCLVVLTKKREKKEIYTEPIEDRASKIGKIIATILALIIIIPIIVIMAIFIPNMK